MINLGNVTFNVGANTAALSAATASMNAFAAQVNRITQQLNTFSAKSQNSFNRTRNAINGSNQALHGFSQALALAFGPLSGLGSRINSFAGLTNSLSLSFAAVAAVSAGVGVGMYELGKQAIQTELKFERIESRLQGLSRSAHEAGADFQIMKAIADQTGNSFVVLAEQWTNVKAASKNTTLEGQKMIDIFRNISVAAAKFKLSGVQVEATFKAISQMLSKGTVQMEELKGQLGDQLPIAMQAAAMAMGTTTQKLADLIRKGKVTTEEFLEPFSKAIAQILGVDVNERIDSLTASIGRFYNAMDFFNQSLNDAVGYSTTFKYALEQLTAGINWASQNLTTIGQVAGIAAAALLGLATPGIITAVFALVRGFTALIVPIRAVGLAANALPFVRLISLITAVVTAVATLRGTTLGIANVINSPLKVSVDNYIKLQENMKVASQSTTQQLISDVKAQIEALQTQTKAMVEAQQNILRISASNRADFTRTDANRKKLRGWIRDIADALQPSSAGPANTDWFDELLPTTDEKIRGTQIAIDQMKASVTDYTTQLDKLQQIAKKPDFASLAKPPELKVDNKYADRIAKATREANQAIEALRAERNAVGQGPQAYELFQKQEEINKKIQDFRDRLIDAKVPLSEVKRLTAEYGAALKGLQADLEGPFAGLKRLAELMQTTVADGFKSFADAFADAVVEGKVNANTFIDIVKGMVKRVLSEMLMLKVMNPILNSIFKPTTPYPTLGGNSGKGAGGGFFDTLIGGLGSALGGLFGSKTSGARQAESLAKDTYTPLVPKAVGSKKQATEVVISDNVGGDKGGDFFDTLTGSIEGALEKVTASKQSQQSKQPKQLLERQASPVFNVIPKEPTILNNTPQESTTNSIQEIVNNTYNSMVPKVPLVPKMFESSETPVTPKIPEALETPKAQKAQKAPRFEVPVTPKLDALETPKFEAPEIVTPKTPKFETPPKFEAPEVLTPKTPKVLKLEAPEVETPKFATPKVPKTPRLDAPEVPETPKLDAPETPKTPRFATPEVPETPKFATPEMPKFEAPRFEAPEVPETPKFEAPEVLKLPAFETPTTPRFATPEVPETPKFETPEVPETPKFATPEVSKSSKTSTTGPVYNEIIREENSFDGLLRSIKSVLSPRSSTTEQFQVFERESTPKTMPEKDKADEISFDETFKRGGNFFNTLISGISGALGNVFESGVSTPKRAPATLANDTYTPVMPQTPAGKKQFMKVIINDKVGANISATQVVDSRGEPALDVTIDKVVSSKISRPGTSTNRAVRNMTGAKPLIVAR